MKKNYLLTYFIIFISINALSQDYEHALGIRLAPTAGFVYTKMINDEKANSAMISFKGGGAQLALGHRYYKPFDTGRNDRFFVFYGYGFHAGYRRFSDRITIFDNKKYKLMQTTFAAGIYGIVGVEYHFEKKPFIMTFDYRPSFDLYLPVFAKMNNMDFGISFYYIF